MEWDRERQGEKTGRMKKGGRMGETACDTPCGWNQSQKHLRNHWAECHPGPEAWEGENWGSERGELPTRQREIVPWVSGWRAVRGADRASSGLGRRRSKEEL